VRPAQPRWLESRGPARGFGVTCGVCCPSRRRRRSPASIWARWWCWTSTPRWSPRTRRRSTPPRPSRAASGSTRSESGCDNTTELLAISLRPGNAGSNHAGDHIDVLGRAIAQVPAAYRRRLLMRADGAGATHELLDWLTGPAQVRGRRLEYSVGFPTKNTALTSAITTIPEPVWTRAITTDGEIRDGADVAEVTALLDLRRWPAGMRVIVRRERPHPGAQLSLLEEADGWRYQAFATNTRVGQLAFLEARHRAHAGVEDRIKAAKDTGLGVLSHDVGDTPARSLTGRRPPSAVEMFMSSLLGGLHAPP
jgi:Transposase DDE domain group 1